MPLSKAKNRERMRESRPVQPKCNLTQYPAILEALVNPIKRQKLIKIYESLKNRGLQREVRYGVFGPTFEIVGELLEVTA